MENVEINLCTEITNEMVRLGFKESSVSSVKSKQQYIDAFNQQNPIQRTLLTMIFYNIFIEASFTVPSQIRLALNIANDVPSWVDDIKLVILPFLLENEAAFFG